MRVPAIAAIAAVLTMTSVTIPISAATSKTAMLPAISVMATADQKFKPDHIVLHVGKTQTIKFTSAGGVHGIISKELGIPSTMIVQGKTVPVRVTAKKAGTYKVPCSIVCGPGHADMSLTVQVKP